MSTDSSTSRLSSNSDEAFFESLVDEYMELMRKGNPPTISQFADRYPAHAEEIRELFPMLCLMERVGESNASGSPLDTGPSIKPLSEIGDYLITQEVGRGGMGVVYEAEHKLLGRRVALKVLPPQLVISPKYRTRFFREARAAARLHHTNIVPVFDFGEDDGIPYYAMQFIDGDGLDELIHNASQCPNRELTENFLVDSGSSSGSSSIADASTVRTSVHWRRIARIGRQAAEALHYAHNQGILHRDVKPSNILIDSDKNVWITDFGLAKTDDDLDLTATGDFVGTLRYLAPETLKGQSDRRSDICGLGLVLYELVALQPAFDERERGSLIAQISQTGPTSIGRLCPRAPRDLRTIINKAIERDPRLRYQTGRELSEDLRRFMADEPIRARPISMFGHLWRWARRNRAIASLLSTIVALLVMGVVLASMSSIKMNRLAQDRGEALRTLARQQDQQLLELFESHVAEAAAFRNSGQPGQRFRGLAAIREAANILPLTEPPSDALYRLRSEAIGCLGMADITPTYSWPNPPFSRYQCSYHAPTDQIAYVTPHKKIRVQRIHDEEITFEVAGHFGETIKISSNGKWLSCTTPNKRLIVYNLDSHDRVFDQPVYSSDCCFNDDCLLAYHAADNQAVVVNLENGETVFSKAIQLGRIDIALSHSGSRLAVDDHTTGQKLIVWDVETGSELLNVSPGKPCLDIAWNSNERELAISVGYDIQIWDIENRRRRFTLEGHTLEVFKLAYMKDRDILFSSSWGHESIMWNTTSGKQLLMFGGTIGWTDLVGEDNVVGFHRGNAFERCDVAVGLEQLPMLGTKDRNYFSSPRGMAVHPDGRLAVLATSSGLRFADTVTGADLGEIIMGFCKTVCFDPDGKFMISSDNSCVYRWEISKDGKRQLTLGPPEKIKLPKPFERTRAGTVCSAILDPDGRTLTVSQHYVNDGYNDFCQIDLKGERPTATFKMPYHGIPRSSARNGTRLLFRNRTKCFVFDTAKEATLMLAEAQLVGGTFSRSGRFAGIAGDEVAFLYDVDNEEKRFDINSKYEYAWLTSFSEDESLLLIGVKSPAGSLVVDTESGRSLAFIPAQPDAIPRDVPPIWVSKTQRVVTFGRFNELVAWDWKSIQQQLVDLGLDWESTGNNEEYVVDYQPIQLTIAMDEELRQFHMTRGVDYRTHWPMQTTYESISSRIASNPDDVPLLLERARLTLDYHIGLLELARIDLDRAIGLSPENQTARDLRSQLARRRADWAEHIAQLKAVLEFAPSDHYRLRLIQALTLSPKRWQDLEFAKTLGEELEIPNLASRDYPQYVSALAAIDYCGGDLESAHDRLVGIAKFPWQTRPLLARIQWELGWKDKAYATYSAWQKGLSKRVHGPLTFRHAALLLQPIVSSKRLETGLNRLKFYPVELACHSIPESGPVNIQGLPRQSKLGHIFYWGATQAASMTLSITVDQPGRYSMTAALAAWDSAGAVSFEVNGKQVGDDPVEKSSQQPRVDLHAIGEVDLIAGENTITVFAHPSKATSRCRVGIAYLEFSRLASSND